MDEKVIYGEALERIKNIHRLSQAYNGSEGNTHNNKLLELMRHHIDEIEELYKDHNPHYLTEVGDLMILCCEMLLENKESVDDIFIKCFGRYETKLNQLLEEKK